MSIILFFVGMICGTLCGFILSHEIRAAEAESKDREKDVGNG